MLDGPVVALIVLALGVAVAAAYFLWDHRRHGRAEERAHARPVERLPLFGTDLLATRGEDGALHTADEDGAPRRPAPARPTPPARPAVPFAPPPSSLGIPAQPLTPRPPRPANGTHAAPVAGGDPAFANGETLRFALPDEGTLRFLPGRLEVVAGPDAGREVRFVAPPGASDRVEVTFGRTEGPAYRHIQLLARTVSRQHASMCLSDEHWSLKNLSATNPVVLNGRRLAPDEVAPLLIDGDRIEMGEVVFTFHGR